MKMSKEPTLVPDRNCDQCVVCCVTLRIEESSLKKHADDPCPHLIAGKGCGIYATRPSVCRTWHCAWRYMPKLGDEWRPDRSKILLRLHDGGLILQPLESPLKVLTSRLALTLVGDCVSNSVPVFISVPGKKGHCYCLVQLNEGFASAIESRDFSIMQATMTNAVDFALQSSTALVQPFEAS